MTAISINKYIYNILSNDDELKKMVGIYPLIADDSATFPFIIYKRTNIQAEYTKDGRIYDNVDFTITVVTTQYEQSVNIAERVRSLIELNKEFTETRLVNVTEDFTEDSYIQELSFTTIIR